MKVTRPKIEINEGFLFYSMCVEMWFFKYFSVSLLSIVESKLQCVALERGLSTYMAEVSFFRAVITVGRIPAGLWIPGFPEGSFTGLQRNKKTWI